MRTVRIIIFPELIVCLQNFFITVCIFYKAFVFIF